MANDLNRPAPYWARNFSAADVSGCEEIKTAPSKGALYLERILISCVSAITVTIGMGETSGAVTTVLLGPFDFVVGNGAPIDIKFTEPIKLTDLTSLTVDGGGAGIVAIIAEGFTR